MYELCTCQAQPPLTTHLVICRANRPSLRPARGASSSSAMMEARSGGLGISMFCFIMSRYPSPPPPPPSFSLPHIILAAVFDEPISSPMLTWLGLICIFGALCHASQSPYVAKMTLLFKNVKASVVSWIFAFNHQYLTNQLLMVANLGCCVPVHELRDPVNCICYKLWAGSLELCLTNSNLFQSQQPKGNQESAQNCWCAEPASFEC